MRPDSLLRLWRYINYIHTYLLTFYAMLNCIQTKNPVCVIECRSLGGKDLMREIKDAVLDLDAFFVNAEASQLNALTS